MESFNTENKDTNNSPIAGLTARTPKRRVVLYGTLVVLFILLVGAFMVSRSVPGDTLYGIKRGVLEGVGGISITQGGEAAEQVERMRTRLEELKQIHANDARSDNNLKEIAVSSFDHARRFKELVTAEDSSVTTDDALGYVSDMTSIIRADERIIEFGNERNAGMEIERARKYVVDLRNELIVALANEGDGTMARDFIAEHLDVLSAAINEGDLSRSRIAVTEDYVEDVAEALIADDLEDALEAVTKAEELIELDRYLRDVSEDPNARG